MCQWPACGTVLYKRNSYALKLCFLATLCCFTLCISQSVSGCMMKCSCASRMIIEHPMTYICSQSTISHHAQKLIYHGVLIAFLTKICLQVTFESYLPRVKVTCPEFMDVHVRSFRYIKSMHSCSMVRSRKVSLEYCISFTQPES